MGGAWWFVSDLHGSEARYDGLFAAAAAEAPAVILLGGDLLPGGTLLGVSAGGHLHHDFVADVLGAGVERLRRRLGPRSPRILLIPGNDDPRFEEAALLHGAAQGLWDYLHDRRIEVLGRQVHGYAYVPPTPFPLKDWERYDVSRYLDPGASSPEEGIRSVPVSESEARWSTIRDDLARLAEGADPDRSVWLFHAPPYRSALDRADLDGRCIDHVPLDVHVGSLAVREMIESVQPRVTLHGHVHESARLTGRWCEQIGRTWCLGAAHDGPELALVRFDPEHPASAERRLLGADGGPLDAPAPGG